MQDTCYHLGDLFLSPFRDIGRSYSSSFKFLIVALQMLMKMISFVDVLNKIFDYTLMSFLKNGRFATRNVTTIKLKKI